MSIILPWLLIPSWALAIDWLLCDGLQKRSAARKLLGVEITQKIRDKYAKYQFRTNFNFGFFTLVI